MKIFVNEKDIKENEQLRKENEELKSHLKKCKACGEYDFIDNINNFCCYCGKDIDTGYTLEEMKEKGLPYPIDKRNSQTKLAVEKLEELLKYDLLQKELEIYKRALKSACEWIDGNSWSITDGTAEDWERAKQTTNDFYLKKARKELEDEHK